jgi:NTE family protein
LCIGSDIETGKQVILNKGNLAEALLASSAFPSLFSPVEIDGQLLSMVGLLTIIPLMRLESLEQILCVDVQDDLRDRTTLKDATKI